MTPRIACQIVVRLLFGYLLLSLFSNAVSQIAIFNSTPVPEGSPSMLATLGPVLGFQLLALIGVCFAAPLFSVGLPNQPIEVSISPRQAMRVGVILVGAVLLANGISILVEVPHVLAGDAFQPGAFVGSGVQVVLGFAVIAASQFLTRLLLPTEREGDGIVG